MAVQSVEPNVADFINSQLKSYGLDYKLEQESLNNEIDKALSEYFTKNGGSGANRPDCKLLLQDESLNFYPVLIEYKGYKDKLSKLDSEGNVENRKKDNTPNFKNINSYAVNGAVHYANALLHHTSYTDIIAIGVTGHKDIKNELKIQIGVYFVSKSNLGVGQKVGDFSDLSFLKAKNFDEFTNKLKNLSLSPEELEKIKQKRESEIDASLLKLNNDIYQNEKGLGENDRVYLVAASIIATLGIPGVVRPLEKDELKSSNEVGNTDGEILMRKIKAFLNHKNLPKEKQDLIVRTLSNTILSENINKITNGETQLKRVFNKIVDDLGIYYKIGLTTDFTGKLFNEMYSWLGFTQDKLNDVVLTPSYVATLLARLARVNKDSYVWDFATGSAGLLVAAMNEMLNDAKNSIKSPDELRFKELKIKAEQLLGLEILSSVYMLAVLNMIMMGDGSSNILNKNSLNDFDGEYGFGKENKKFPADAFVLNPPYSAEGNGMIFVEHALKMMSRGYASVIIQNSAGSGKAKDINKRILERNTLIASIKMPNDLFVGKSNVQTNIYVFKVGERHEKDEMVKFIDFSNDGYGRKNRKKAKSSVNLKDVANAKDRYDELVNLVRFGKSKLKIFSENEYYETTIDPENGADWNKSRPVDTKPTLADFKKTISDYLSWEVSQILKKDSPSQSKVSQNLENLEREFKASGGEFKEFRLENLFESFNGNFDIQKEHINGLGEYVVTAGLGENGILGKTNIEAKIFNENTLTVDMFGNAFYRNFKYKMVTHARVFCLKPLFEINQKQGLFIATSLHFLKYKFGYGNMCSWAKIKDEKILLPTEGGKISFAFMQSFVEELESERVEELEAYLAVTGLKNYNLTNKEKDALAKFDEFSKWGGVASEFKIGDLFDKVNLRNVKFDKKLNVSSEKSEKYNIPLVNAKHGDNGIMFYGESEIFDSVDMSICIVQNGAVATGDVYPQPYKTGVLWDAYLIKSTDRQDTREALLYFSTAIHKSIKQKFFYEFKATWDRVKDEPVLLPTKNNAPDYEFMNDFIKAVQKLVIKDVVLWADKKIEATKKAVANCR